MNVIDRALARLGYIKQDGYQAPAWARAGWQGERDAIPDGEDVAKQGELYAKLSWIQIAVSIYAQSAAATPLHVEELQGEETKAINNHAFEQRIRQPNPLQSRFEFLESHFSFRRLTGNCYWWLNRSTKDDEPTEMWIIPSQKIRPVPDGRMFLKGYLYDPGDSGRPIPLEPWEVCHFKTWNPRSQYVGLSVVEALAIGAHGDLAAQRYDANFYDKDNAKVPGALAFADPISDPDWKRMKAEIDQQHGGTKRKLMMLRNVGKGGVEWVQMSLSHADMQYLEKRQFTKEEIFSIIAPGLASAIAINANEASGRTGDAVFNARALYPAHVATAEKITADILPAYGPNLVAGFEDVRHKDRQLELQEQRAAAQVLTIDELRKKYYQEDPIGDERGRLLPAEVGKGPTDARSAEAKEAAAAAAEPAAPPEMTMDPAVDPDAEPGAEPADDAAGPSVILGGPQDAASGELAKWERKALKRLRANRSPVCSFDSDILDDATIDDITHRLHHAVTDEDVRSAFKKAPGDGLTPEESALYDRLRVLFGRAMPEVARAIAAGGSVDTILGGLSGQIAAALASTLSDVVNTRIADLGSEIGLVFEVADVGADVAGAYLSNYLTGMEATTKRAVERAVDLYRSRPGMTVGDLTRLLDGPFGVRRAELIAVTSITEASSQATQHYQTQLRTAGIESIRVWKTNVDERVCPICGPLHGQTEATWGQRLPRGAPAHLRCRCMTTLQVQL